MCTYKSAFFFFKFQKDTPIDDLFQNFFFFCWDPNALYKRTMPSHIGHDSFFNNPVFSVVGFFYDINENESDTASFSVDLPQ